jgi:hypothetical protein
MIVPEGIFCAISYWVMAGEAGCLIAAVVRAMRLAAVGASSEMDGGVAPAIAVTGRRTSATGGWTERFEQFAMMTMQTAEINEFRQVF